jgi:hypothetical protein
LASLLHRDDPELVMKAFQSLPLRWMTVLWHAEVEREPPRKIAPVLGMEPGAVSALLLRARKGLREAYLSAYAEAPLRSDCEPTFPYLAATVLGTSSARDRRKVNEHTRDCEDCAKVLAQLTDVGATMRGIVAPFVLLGPVLGGARFPLHFPSRWAGTAAAAGVVTLTTGAVAAVAVAGGLVSSGPSAAPPPQGTVLNRAVPASSAPAPSPASVSTATPTHKAGPVDGAAPPALDYPAGALSAEPDTGASPGSAHVGPWPPVRANGPRSAAGGVPDRPTASPTSTPAPTAVASPSVKATPTPGPTWTSTPTAAPPAPLTPIVTPTPTAAPTPTPTITPTEPPREPICPIILGLCFTI